MLATFKLTAAQSEGQMTVLEVLVPAGWGAPLHIHHAEDEAFHLLEGEVTFEVGDTTVVARPGDFLVGPRGVPHRFTVGDEPARMIWTLTPGGFDRFVVEASEPAQAPTLPPTGLAPEDLPWLVEVAARHDIELLV
jgi:mannose-6-phosphate isomerase-like protein (cupin superfamily)